MSTTSTTYAKAHPARRRITSLLAATALIGALAGCAGDGAGTSWDTGGPGGGAGAVSSAVAGTASPSPSGVGRLAPAPITYPQRGEGRWRVAPGASPVAGRRGTLLTFRVAVERGIANISAADFAADVVQTLSDERSWTATGDWRLQRVGPGDPHDFTVYLATPDTRDVLCGSGRDGYTSCRNGNSVVINIARWAHGVPSYGSDLTAYRQYVINHEVGHRLGWWHETCPGKGQPAPVMQQQTLGLHGCKPNSWPLVDGEHYRGPTGVYDDPIPTTGS